MNLTLWIIAGLMAVVFLVAGANKLFIPKAKLAKAPGGGWALDFSAGFIKALGAVEILGAVGLILPALLDIAPFLVPLEAVGLALIMVGATSVEFRHHAFKHVLLNLTYLALAVFVAWGRFGPESFRWSRVMWYSHPARQVPSRAAFSTSVKTVTSCQAAIRLTRTEVFLRARRS